jgi:predicted Zn finger-like uncharacterized protein
VKFLCEQCKAKYQIADEKAVGKTVRMKCRKCGHLIEVRAAVTETSVSSAMPMGDRASAPPRASSPPRPPPPRIRPLPVDTGGGVQAAAFSRPERVPGALEGAFKQAVQQDTASASVHRRQQRERDEVSAPFDMADLSPNDQWYVAINGVPVGPVRIAEVRRKAALGAVSEDSLVWQDGLDEWRPLRLFPELAASVREAMSRTSRPPSADARGSLPPPPPTRPPSRSVPPPAFASRMAPPRGLASPSPFIAPRSNVVPFMSRLATAERLEPVPHERVSPVPGPPVSHAKPVSPSIVPDPFAGAPAAMAPAPGGPSPAFIIPPELRRSPPWTQLAMIAAATAFGITAAIIWLSRPSGPPPAPVVWPASGPQSAVTTASSIPPPILPAATAEAPESAQTAAPPVARVTASPRGGSPPPAATASGTGRSLDLHSLAQSAPAITPTDEPASDAPKSAAGQSLTEGQVQQVIAAHRTAVGRVCWERNPSAKTAVGVNVILTVGADGSAQSVGASGDESSVAKCVENEVRGWRFPATGSSQRTTFSIKFLKQ